ncbi:chaplin [Streptomyces sp. NPDC050095]|uniref:chaplin n=1 Tax=unclassified Streptomyces TaxID=2593676 RepID=UPI00343ABB73
MKFRTAVVSVVLVVGGVFGAAGAAVAHDGGAGAQGAAVGSPGVLSGNVVQVPVSIPVNVCGNSINVIGLLNPAVGNTCING